MCKDNAGSGGSGFLNIRSSENRVGIDCRHNKEDKPADKPIQFPKKPKPSPKRQSFSGSEKWKNKAKSDNIRLVESSKGNFI